MPPTISQQQLKHLVDLYNRGELERASALGEELTRQFPGSPLLENLLGAVNVGLGRLDEAVSNFTEAAELKTDYAEAHNNLGNALVRLGRSDEAVASYERALAIRPKFAEAHNNLGNALCALGKTEAAVASFTKALEINPGYAEAHFNLGNALRDVGKLDLAVASYTNALRIRPDYAQAHNKLGVVLRDLRKPEEAVSCYRRALEIDPDYAQAHNNLGNALRNLGDLEAALASYERALELEPGYVEAHRNLSTAKTFEDSDPQIMQMRELAERRNMTDAERMHLNFALAQAYGDIGDYDAAFVCLADGNRLRRAELRYDTAATRKSFAEIRAVFSNNPPRLVADARSPREGSRIPVFVLGMPRSGTSLVEQILASHSRVYGAGEVNFLEQAIRAIEWKPGPMTPDQLRSVRESYFASQTTIRASEPFVTDKHLLNFRWIGFICAALPEAKIVHVERDPRATCWSNFKHFFSSDAIGFAYDLHEIAEYYEMYADLMDFWRERFPGRIYDLGYEHLTENQQAETRKLLNYIGLEWEEGCLEFHKTERAVQTASDTQVRQAIYQGSSNEWRNYTQHLKPMLEILSRRSVNASR